MSLLEEDACSRPFRSCKNHGGIVAAAGSIVDRSGGSLPDFGCPFVSLVQMNVETFEPDKLPEDLAGIPAIKPGSK